MLPSGPSFVPYEFTFTPLNKTQAVSFLKEKQDIILNYCNPRHKSTVALIKLIIPNEPIEGFVSLEEGDDVLVVLPPKELATRTGEEIELTDLEACQFWLVS